MNDELRMYIVFRADLPEMHRGKSEAQAGHAAASLIYQALTNPNDSEGADRVLEYMGEFIDEVREGQAKIVMEVPSFIELAKIIERAKNRNVNTVLIRDEGRTVFGHPTYTCVGIGPCSKTDGNSITRGARMRA